MQIDFNETECKSMEANKRGDLDEGARLQGIFLDELKESMKNGEPYCPCTANCDLHGKCTICVAVHRGHGDHLPVCMHPLLNKKIVGLSELSEHSVAESLRKPEYLE